MSPLMFRIFGLVAIALGVLTAQVKARGATVEPPHVQAAWPAACVAPAAAAPRQAGALQQLP